MCINEEETEQSVMKAEASTILHLPIMLSLMGENNLTIIIFLKKNLVLRVLASYDSSVMRSVENCLPLIPCV